jgi:hypothetical protein
MQGDRLQHKEMGKGLIGLANAVARLHIVFPRAFRALRSDRVPSVRETDLRCGGSNLIVSEMAFASQESHFKSVPKAPSREE